MALITTSLATQAQTKLIGVWNSRGFTCGGAPHGYTPQYPPPPSMYVTYRANGKFFLETEIPIEQALGCRTRYDGTYIQQGPTLIVTIQSYDVDITCLQASEIDDSTINKIEAQASQKVGKKETSKFIIHEDFLYTEESNRRFSTFVCKNEEKKLYLSFQRDK